MKLVWLIAVLGLMIGCASAPIEGEIDKETNQLVKFKFDPRYAGKGCAYLKRGENGEFVIIVQQDGTSDWITGRALGFVTGVVSKLPLIGGMLMSPYPMLNPFDTGPEFQGPDHEMRGCEGLQQVLHPPPPEGDPVKLIMTPGVEGVPNMIIVK